MTLCQIKLYPPSAPRACREQAILPISSLCGIGTFTWFQTGWVALLHLRWTWYNKTRLNEWRTNAMSLWIQLLLLIGVVLLGWLVGHGVASL